MYTPGTDIVIHVKAHDMILPAINIAEFLAKPIRVQPPMMKGIANNKSPLLPILSLMILPGIIKKKTLRFKIGANQDLALALSFISESVSSSSCGSAEVG